MIGPTTKHAREQHYLAKLDAPLIKRVDAPHNSLAEDLVLIKRDQLAQCSRSQAREQNRVARTIAVKNLLRRDQCNISGGHACRFELRPASLSALAVINHVRESALLALLQRLAVHESFGLRQKIG